MINQQLSQVIKHWGHVAPFVSYPKNKKQFDELVHRLDSLLDIVGNNEGHPLMSLVDFLSHMIEDYEENHYSSQKKSATGTSALKFLMENHQLKQSDLPEIGSQGVVSEVLHGKRVLNLRQILLLSKRFSVDPSTFIDEK